MAPILKFNHGTANGRRLVEYFEKIENKQINVKKKKKLLRFY